MSKCRHAKSYKGKNPPKCGCDMCNIIWKIESDKRQLINKIKQLEDKLYEIQFPF